MACSLLRTPVSSGLVRVYILERHPEYPEGTPSSIEEEAEGVSKGAGLLITR